MAELHGRRISAVLAADAKLDIRPCLSALLRRHLNQLAHAVLIKSCEGIGFIDLALVLLVKEITFIVSGESKGHLLQVIGSA